MSTALTEQLDVDELTVLVLCANEAYDFILTTETIERPDIQVEAYGKGSTRSGQKQTLDVLDEADVSQNGKHSWTTIENPKVYKDIAYLCLWPFFNVFFAAV